MHVKLDTGMGRLGHARRRARRRGSPTPSPRRRGLELAGAMTHFATADEPRRRRSSREQLARFARVGASRCARATPALVAARRQQRRDAARPGGALRPGALRHRDLRPGPVPARTRPTHGLEPALELRSYVAEVKPIAPGESAGYGRRFVAERDDLVGALPIGYGDGLRRGADQQRRRARRRAPLPAASGRSAWTTSPSTSARRAGVRPRRRGGADRRAGRRADHSPRRSRGAWTRSTTRSPAGSPRACRACTTATGVPRAR